MEINLKKEVKGATIIEGFPGFGLIGSIASEFLIEHLKCDFIGAHWFEKLPATVAVHDGKIIKPLNIYHNEERNLMIVHAISGGPGIEWDISDFILKLAQKVEAKEIVSLEGVGAMQSDDPKVYHVATAPDKKEHLKSLDIQELKEGIIVGVTSALMMKCTMPMVAFFAETHSELPDSKAAAKVIEALNKYLDLHIDPQPLLEQAQKFEEKLNKIISQGTQTQEELRKKQLNYVG